jgi:hypothetical protein
MIMMAFKTDGNHRYSRTKNQRFPFVSWTRTAHFTPQHNQLMPERHVHCFKSALRLEGQDQQGQDEGKQRDHSAPTLGDSLT